MVSARVSASITAAHAWLIPFEAKRSIISRITSILTPCSSSCALVELDTLRRAMKKPRMHAETPIKGSPSDSTLSAGTARKSPSPYKAMGLANRVMTSVEAAQ